MGQMLPASGFVPRGFVVGHPWTRKELDSVVWARPGEFKWHPSVLL